MFDLDNKTTVITGGGSGIGRAMSVLFAEHGAVVHILDLDAAAAAGTVNAITARNGKAFSHTCDVSDQQQVIDTFDKIGKVDILINNAGIAHIGRADNT